MNYIRYYILYVLYIIIYIIIGLILERNNIKPLSTADENYYKKVGLSYLEGIAPIDMNFEHPPLAKYIIGACYTVGIGELCSHIFVAISIVLISLMFRNINYYKASILILLASFDPLILSLSTHDLLDTYMLFFISLTLYIYTTNISKNLKAILLGMASGLALASKLVAIFVIVPLLLFYIVKERKIKIIFILFMSATIAYTVTYIQDIIIYGPQSIIEHHVKMIEYMGKRHGFSPAIATNGLMKYFLRIELWGKTHIIEINITFNKTAFNYTASIIKLDKPQLIVEATPWFTNILMVIIPGIIIASCSNKNKLINFFKYLTLSSYIMFIYGPLWWYYLLPVLFGYIFYFVYIEYIDEKKRDILINILLLSILITWIIYVIDKFII